MRRSGFFICLFLGLLTLAAPLSGLDPRKAVTQYKLDVWQAARGFPQSSVFAVLQTRDGYVWLGTMGGVVRFDGIRFTVFNKDNPGQLEGNVVMALLEDRHGALWIGTAEGGLSCLKNGVFTTYSADRHPGLKEISTLFEDREGALWIGTLNSGLCRLKDGILTTYTTADGLTGNRVRAFLQDEDGRLWIATAAGLTIRDRDGTFTAYTGKTGRFDKYILTLCKTRNGELWLGCEPGLYCLKDGEFTYSEYNRAMPDLTIQTIYEDKRGNLWIGADTGGLSRIRNGKIETLSTLHGLASGTIVALHEDVEGNLWLGSIGGGLHRLRDTVVTPYTTREGLSHDIVHCIREDRAGHIWIGTGNGLNRLTGGSVSPPLTTRHGLADNDIWSVLETGGGDLWIGTAVGPDRFRNGKVEHFSRLDPMLRDYTMQMAEDSEGAVWFLSYKSLSRFHNGELTVFARLGEGVAKYKTLWLGREGTVWAGGSLGLYKLHRGRLTHYTVNDGLPSNEVECVYQNKNGTLYLGTRGGLSRMTGGEFTNITIRNGLTDNNVRHVTEDREGDLWLAVRTGILRIPKKELSDFFRGGIERIHPEVFDESDGLKNPWCEDGVVTRDGRLWFTSSKGLMMIDPGNIKRNTLPPPVLIEALKVDGETVNISGRGPESRAKGRPPVMIPPGKKRLEIYYTGISFIKPRKMKFKLKLEGYDTDWVDAGNARSTTYTGLSPGKYTFTVTACNSDGVWNPLGASLTVYKKPFFYQTTLFYLSAALLFLLAAFTGYRYRVRHLKARQKELKELVELRTHDLKERNLQLETAHQNIRHAKDVIEENSHQLEEQSEKLKEMDRVKSRFFANISHEFRTPLTLIMGPLEQILSGPGKRGKAEAESLSLALRNSQRLLSLINQLLDLSKLDSGKMQLHAVHRDAIPFLKGVVGSFESLTVQKRLGLTFQTGETRVPLYFDPGKLSKVVINLVANALKFTPAGGSVTVTAACKHDGDNMFPGGCLEIIVRDTGPGIPEEQLPYIFDRFYQTEDAVTPKHNGSGIGLALVNELVSLHHGAVEVQSTEGEGAVFFVRLPLGAGHLKKEEIAAGPEPEPRAGPGDIPSAEILEAGPGADGPGADGPGADGPDTVAPGFSGDTENEGKEKDIILVVDDNPDVRQYIRGPLQDQFTVVEAADGKEGIRKARDIIPDLIISDVMMPEIDGFQLTVTLKKDLHTSHIPIILLTARASNDSIVEGLETGADDYITKPFNVKILLTRIKNLIDLRRGLQEKIQRELLLKPAEINVTSIDQEFMKELQTAIEKNLSEPDFSVDDLAGVLYMSRATLNRKIRALTGESTHQFIRSYRLKRAAQLLRDKFGNVTEVAFEVGFSTSAYFTKCFKEKFNQLPHVYQASQ